MIDRIPNGYRVAVLTPDGTIADILDVEDSDLRHTLAALDLGQNVMQVVERNEAQAAKS